MKPFSPSQPRCCSSCRFPRPPSMSTRTGRRSGWQRQRQLPDVVRARPAAGFQSRRRAAAFVLVRAGDRGIRRRRRRRTPRARWPIGAWRSADGAIRSRGFARRSRSSSDEPPFNARSTTGTPTPRERAYIAAAAELFTSGDASTQRARTVAYEQGMERVVRDFPGDMEARIFYALAANQTALASDKNYSQQLKAAAILEPLFKEHPKHPGLAHYIIHAYDHPPLAEKALDAARSYASLAPSVPHALHMPSHTFTRVGLWKESIETNRRSAEAARKENATAEELHAMDYQTYAYLQIAKDGDARRVTDEARAAFGRLDPNAAGAAAPGVAGVYAAAAIPARYALERGAWAEAAASARRAQSTFPHTDAITHFARALGAARSGNPKAAAADVERLAALRDALKTMQDAYWAEQVDIQRQIAIAWITFAEGDKARGIELLRAAAATPKTPPTNRPSRQARSRPRASCSATCCSRPSAPLRRSCEFEATIKKEPNRFRGLYGGARAAEAAGQRARAIALYTQLLQVASDPDTNRPELQHARSVVK